MIPNAQNRNKIQLLIVFLALQMEAFAQRGRSIPQDWGGGGGSSPYSSALSDLWFFLLLAVFLGVLFIIFFINSINNKGKDTAAKQAKTSQQPSKYERYVDKLYSEEDLKRKQQLLKQVSDSIKALPDSYFNTECFTFPKEWRIIPSELIDRIRSRAIYFTNAGIDFDVCKLNKFEIIIFPHGEDTYFRQLLIHYKGYVTDDGFKGVIHVGPEMTISAFVAFHGKYELKQADNQAHYLQAKDGTRVFFFLQLEELCKQSKVKGIPFALDENKLKVREYFSMKEMKFRFGAYYKYKGKE